MIHVGHDNTAAAELYKVKRSRCSIIMSVMLHLRLTHYPLAPCKSDPSQSRQQVCDATQPPQAKPGPLVRSPSHTQPNDPCPMSWCICSPVGCCCAAAALPPGAALLAPAGRASRLLAPECVRTLVVPLLLPPCTICILRSISCMVVVLIAAFQRSRPREMLSDELLGPADELGTEGMDPATALPLVAPLPAAAVSSADRLLPEPACSSPTIGSGESRSRVEAVSMATMSGPNRTGAPDPGLGLLQCDALPSCGYGLLL